MGLLRLNLHHSYAALPPVFYRVAAQVPLRLADVFAYNQPLSRQLGLNPDAAVEDILSAFNGDGTMSNSRAPLWMAYGGHQFGVWVPQLGDGRGLLLGEVKAPDGETYDLHIKGSGPGYFSRGFDGRAVLRSTIREYLGSEAMHHLGIATTRSLALISSQEPVLREEQETGALLVRVARSHVRFGTFEYFHHRADTDSVLRLAHYVANRHYPNQGGEEERPALVLEQAILATARMIAGWQAVGFCHGVMNTDNMGILGETLDYGPYGFMDAYNPGHICNRSDQSGRYAYNRQPFMGLWNCRALAVSLSSLVSEQRAGELLSLYQPEFQRSYTGQMGRRLGLADGGGEDMQLITNLLSLLVGKDFNHTLRQLYRSRQQDWPLSRLAAGFADPPAFEEWHAQWLARSSSGGPDVELMRRHNPAVVLRNSHAQAAIERAHDGDSSEFEQLLNALRQPFRPPEQAHYSEPPLPGSKSISLSCSS